MRVAGLVGLFRGGPRHDVGPDGRLALSDHFREFRARLLRCLLAFLFSFAVAPEFPQDILPDDPGLIVADGFGGAVVRDAPVIGLAPARRKALTLAFARLGAMRTLRD